MIFTPAFSNFIIDTTHCLNRLKWFQFIHLIRLLLWNFPFCLKRNEKQRLKDLLIQYNMEIGVVWFERLIFWRRPDLVILYTSLPDLAFFNWIHFT